MIEKMELTDLSKYQTDFLLFKNEVLRLLSKHEEKQKKKKRDEKNRYEDISKAQEEQLKRFSQRITDLSNTRFVEQAKLDRIECIGQKVEAISENVSINTIRLATCQRELANAIYKYDKIFMDNLTVPGLVGNYCKHKNLRDFIQFAQDNITNLLQSKGRDQASLQVYKDNIDLLIKQFSLKFDSILKQTFGYTKDAFAECTDNYKIAVQEIYDKMESVRLENSKYAVTLKSQNEEFSKDLETIKGVKTDLFNKMSNTLIVIESKNKEFVEKYDYMKNTFETITDELKKHTGFIKALNQTINELKGNSNRGKGITNVNNNRERMGEEREKDKDKERDNRELHKDNQETRMSDDKLKTRVIEIINDYYLSGAYGKELNGKKMDFRKSVINIDVESNLKKYIKGEITSAEFSPGQKKRGSSFVNLIKRSNHGSPQNEKKNLKESNIPNLNLEEEKDKYNDDNNNINKHYHHYHPSVSGSNSDLDSKIESSVISESVIKMNIMKPFKQSHSNVRDKDRDSKDNTVTDNKSKSKSNMKQNQFDINPLSTTNAKRKNLSIAISSKDEFAPKIKEIDTLQNDETDKDTNQIYNNIFNWKINEKMKSKLTSKNKSTTERLKDTSKEIKKDSSQAQTVSKKGMVPTKDKTKDYSNRYNKDSKNDMITIREYDYNDSKSKQKCKSKDIIKDMNIKSTRLKEQELFMVSTNVFNSNGSKLKREISQEPTNFHCPHIESVSTPHHINPSKSEAKNFFNNRITNPKKPKCKSAKREDGKGTIMDNAQLGSSLKLSKDQIERKLIEIEYYTKKKFDELVSELQKYIPLSFKSHTRYCINDIEESVETQRRNKTPNELEYENDLKHAKISIVTSEVLEKVNDNGAFRSIFPKKSPKYQGNDKKGISSFRKLQQGAKEKDKEKKAYNKTQLLGGNSTNGYHPNFPGSTNANTKEMNLSEGSAYVALNKLFTNIPKSSLSNIEDKNAIFSFDNN